ncbi:MAG: hypothetical protein ACYDIE_01820 [Candidatus Krumholzibacteriia bacterium]
MPTMRKGACLLVPVLVCLASAAAGQEPWCFADVTTAASTQVSLCDLPNGMGWLLTQAKAIGSLARVDATITLTLLTSNGDPCVGAPAEDLWLETTRAGLSHCAGGTTADAPTDVLGRTTWSRALRAGRSSDRQAGEKTLVRIGLPSEFWCGADPTVDILHNSPDIDGNLVVNLSDTVLFAQDYKASTYCYRSDFFFDGAVNLSDVVLQAWGAGARCP